MITITAQTLSQSVWMHCTQSVWRMPPLASLLLFPGAKEPLHGTACGVSRPVWAQAPHGKHTLLTPAQMLRLTTL